MSPNESRQRNRKRRNRNLIFAALTVWILANAIALRQTFRTEKRYVIINADDAGMYPSVNQATIDAMEHGVVSSCSILVPCPAFEDFAKYAAAHPEKDFGVHLDLNCDTDSNRWGPVSSKETVPSLVDSEGFLWRHAEETVQHAKIGDVERELRAQINKALAAGIRITHLDHHLYILYWRPDFLRLYVKLAREYGLPIRYEQNCRLNEFGVSDPECTTAYEQGLIKLRQNDLPVTTEFEARNYNVSPAEKESYFMEVLRQLKPGVTELVIHCAHYQSPTLRPPAADRRAADARVFTSPKMADFIARQGISVISWQSFQRMHDSEKHRVF